MSDIVERLRQWVEALRTQTVADTTVADIALLNGGCVSDDLVEAADEVERLRALLTKREGDNLGYIEKAVAAERERCARLVEDNCVCRVGRIHAQAIAAAIRRGEP